MSDYPHPSPKYFGNGECFLWRASVVESPKPPPSAPETPALSRGTTTISSSSSSSSVSFATAAARNYTPLAPPSEQTLVADLEGVTQQTSSSDVSTPSTGSSTVRPSLLHHADSSASSLGVASGAMATQDSLAATSTSTSSLPTPKTFSPGLPPPSPAPSAPRIRFKAFPHSGENDYYMQCEAHFLSLGAGDGHYGLWLDDGLSRGVSSRCDTFGNEPLSDEGIKFNVLGVEVWVIGASSGS